MSNSLKKYVVNFDPLDFEKNIFEYCKNIAKEIDLFTTDVIAAYGEAIADAFGGDYAGSFTPLSNCFMVSRFDEKSEYFKDYEFKPTRKNIKRVLKLFEKNLEKRVIEYRKNIIRVFFRFFRVKAVGFEEKSQCFILEPIDKGYKEFVKAKFLLPLDNLSGLIEDMIRDKSIKNKIFYCGAIKYKPRDNSIDLLYCTTFSKSFIIDTVDFIVYQIEEKIATIKQEKISADITDDLVKKATVFIKVAGNFSKEEFMVYKNSVQAFCDEVFGEKMIKANIYFQGRKNANRNRS